MSNIKEAPPEERKPSALLPAMGLIMAVCSALISVFSAPIIVDLLNENVSDFESRTEKLVPGRDKVPAALFDLMGKEFTYLHLLIAIVAWFIMMAVFVMVVSGVAGRASLIDQEARTVKPRKSELTPAQIKKYEKKLEQQRLEKIKALKRMKSKHDSEQRRKKVEE